MPGRQNFDNGQPHLYRYADLRGAHEFRLLKLHAGNGDEKITCSLEHCSLGSPDCPAYTALSYTWSGKPKSSIHFRNGSIIRVRENLRSALRSARDNASPSWLWIDAICINQESATERNHQVKLMAEIYGFANKVLVWLQSANESVFDVERAFKLVHEAATYEDSEHSVYRYARKYANEGDWRALERLCKVRYWKRKWIIQELVTARTAILQIGKSTCSMQDFQKFCNQLQQYRDDEAHRRPPSTAQRYWKSIISSPAVRLALQRSEDRSAQRSRWLHDLIERYADNRCGLASDHVYALFSLCGEHRSHLVIDYEAKPLERLTTVLRFVHQYEPIDSGKIMEFAFLLYRLLDIRPVDLREEHGVAVRLSLMIPATILGTIGLLEETAKSHSLRKSVEPLHVIPMFFFDASQNPWRFLSRSHSKDPTELEGRLDMVHFEITGTPYYGLAACRLEQGDAVWRFRNSYLVFAVRRDAGGGARILGRAHLFRHRDPQPDVQHSEQDLSMDLATMLELGWLAAPAATMRSAEDDVQADLKWRIKDAGEIVSRKNWWYEMVVGAGILIFVFLLATVIVRME